MTATTTNPPKTYCQLILEHLQTGQTISTWQAYQLYNITCLAQRIHDLRNRGYAIDSELVTVDGKTFSKYWLTGQTTAQPSTPTTTD